MSMTAAMQGCAFVSGTCSADKKACESSCSANVRRANTYFVAEDRSFSPTNWRMCPEVATYVDVLATTLASSGNSTRKLLESKAR
jgi:hypothetical protein